MNGWIIVTGDSSGLGEVIVDNLLEKGYKVVGISRTTSDRVKRRLRRYSESYRHIDFDLSHVDGLKDVYTKRLKRLGPIIGLVNNAATAYDDVVTNANIAAFEKMLRLNVTAPIMLTKLAIRDMLLHGTSGSIVHISSISAHAGFKGLSMYGATKSALEGFSKGVAREWGERGIRSNCISPGFMETRMSAGLKPEQRNQIYRRTCLKRPTDPKSVAEMVQFLLSERSASITGQAILVDSGSL